MTCVDFSKMSTSQKLARFLKENRAYIGYIRALRNRNLETFNSPTGTVKALNEALDKYGFRGDFITKTFEQIHPLPQSRLSHLTSLSYVIDNSFIWEGTVERHKFWHKLYEWLSNYQNKLNGKIHIESLKVI